MLAALQGAVIAHSHKKNETFDLAWTPTPEIVAQSIAKMLCQAATATQPSTVPEAAEAEGGAEGGGAATAATPPPPPQVVPAPPSDATVKLARWADPAKVCERPTFTELNPTPNPNPKNPKPQNLNRKPQTLNSELRTLNPRSVRGSHSTRCPLTLPTRRWTRCSLSSTLPVAWCCSYTHSS